MWVKQRKNLFCDFVVSRFKQNLGRRKGKTKKPYRSNISHIYRDASTAAIALNLIVWDDIAGVITHAKCCDSRFRGFWVLIPLILLFSVHLACRYHYSVSTTVLNWGNIAHNYACYTQHFAVNCVKSTINF